MNDDLEMLDYDIKIALGRLNSSQREYCLQVTDGSVTGPEARRLAGYSQGGCSSTIEQSDKVRRALRLLRHRKELRVGIDVGRKRQHLLDIVVKHKDETPSVAVSAIKELNSMDGHIAPKQIQLGGHVQVEHVQMSIDSGRPPIDVTPTDSDSDSGYIEFVPDDDFLS